MNSARKEDFYKLLKFIRNRLRSILKRKKFSHNYATYDVLIRSQIPLEEEVVETINNIIEVMGRRATTKDVARRVYRKINSFGVITVKCYYKHNRIVVELS